MLAMTIHEPGGPDVLRPGERPQPVPSADEVLVRVAAAGVNRPDILQRLGRYVPPPGVTDVPGLEIAGTVAAVGANVHRWTTGDQVCALVAGGGYAEYCVAPEVQCLPIPGGLDLIHAAALPEVAFTVWSNVFDRGRLQSGETFLVHGGSSGIGTLAIQLARARGARVFATAGSDEKCRACEGLGAELCVNYRTHDFVNAIRQATDGRGVDVVLDMVAGDYLARNLDLLAQDGRLVIIAQLRGSTSTISTEPILRRRLTVTGSVLRPRSVAEKGAIAGAVHANVWPLVESGAIRVLVHDTFPLRHAAAAHALMESSAHIGKLVLRVES